MERKVQLFLQYFLMEADDNRKQLSKSATAKISKGIPLGFGGNSHSGKSLLSLAGSGVENLVKSECERENLLGFFCFFFKENPDLLSVLISHSPSSLTLDTVCLLS